MWPARDPACRARTIRPGSGDVRVVECGPEDGEPVLLIHGWAASAYSWHHVLHALGDAGWRAIAPDLPGHGLSSPVAPEATAEGPLIEHFIDVLDALSVDRAHVVGQSMGGRLALALAGSHPSRVRSVYAINPTGLGSATGLIAGRAFAMSRWSPSRRPIDLPRWFVAMTLRAVSGSRSWITEAGVDEYWASSQFHWYLASLADLLVRYRWQVVPPGEWSRLTMPVRLAIGGRDRLVRTDLAMARERVPAGSTIDLAPAAGHILQEEVPGAVAGWLLDFLGRRGPPAPA